MRSEQRRATQLPLFTHDMPCPQCQHAAHTYLPCSDSCACPPTVMPGSARIVYESPGRGR